MLPKPTLWKQIELQGRQVVRSSIAGIGLLVVGLAAGQLLAEEVADSQQATRALAELSVEHDEANQVTRITIPSIENHIAWGDVLRGLTRAGHYDDAALRALLPDGQIDLTTIQSQFAITALNLALSPEIQLRVLPASKTRPEAAFLVTLDKRQLGQTRRDLKTSIRKSFATGESDFSARQFGIRFDDSGQASDRNQQLVVVVHGFNSAPNQITGLVRALRAAELPLATYAYPNDQPIAASAKQLARDLKRLAGDQPQRRLALVTHSMGGLVARAVIENAQLDPGNVAKLIMIAPPTHGSQLARLSFGREICEYLFRESAEPEVSRLSRAIGNGLAEADYDLQPGSDFLRELNARQRNDQVRYSLFLGTAGPLSPQQLQMLPDTLDRAAQHSAAVQLVRPQLQEILADFDEVLAGQGDGVVAVKRGRLHGVADTVLLRFTHLGPTSDSPTEGDRELYEAIRLRLRQK